MQNLKTTPNKAKLTETGNRLVDARDRVGGGVVKWRKGAKRYTFPVIKLVSLRDELYSMVTIVNATVIQRKKRHRGGIGEERSTASENVLK